MSVDNDPIIEFFRQIRVAVLLLLLVIGISTWGYWIIGGGNSTVLDALYMTVITVATIGYGEIVDLSNSPGGRIFTIFVSIFGIGILTYLLSTVTAFVVEGELNRGFKRRRMEKKIAQLNGHFIVCGSDVVAAHVARELRATGREVVLVTNNRKELELNFAEDTPLHIIGNPTHESTLQRAGISQAGGLFAIAHDDNLNVMILLTAKPLNESIRLVAHCHDVENMGKMRRVGADSVVSKEQIGGLRIVSEMVRPTVVTFLDVMLRDKDQNLRIEEVELPAAWHGRPISALPLEEFHSLLLLAVRTAQSWQYNPKPDYTLPADGQLIFLCNPHERIAFQEMISDS
ncbi:MAG: potassium transporter TrkA [Magnetococcales bacterium]|nr:NAD-binding protein [Magnetococcales bacterium]NGZ26106.1 potassium transporter TrkA [Magnetococcales bacterium]